VALQTERQPVGTVSLLFSDIEGSTALLERLGAERYGAVLSRHRDLLRDAFAAVGCYEVDCEGDSFFVAFTSAARAVAGAARAQRALAAEAWPDGEELRVRIGVHTGEPLAAPPKYVGLDVHQAARVMQAAHGGQVLLSQATRELVADELPAGVSVRDVGEHRLKDLTRPQRLWQLVVDGLPNDFPALRTLENRPTNLPVQPTRLIGREPELAAIAQELTGGVRLLTLTGPGGVGKTRLAVQGAAELVEEFPRGVFFVTLAPLADAALVLPTIGQTLGLAESDEAFPARLARHIGEERLLLVLDSFEHLLEAAPQIGELLAASATLSTLVTSRSALRLAAEHELPVPPLDVPDPAHPPEPGALSQFDSVALFVERARAIKPGFAVTSANAPAVAELCARLDGLPLALELAAARVKLLPPRALLTRLGRRLDLLTGPRDLPARQRTLRAAIDWSHDLLRPDEQQLLARLAVFHGGCTLEAAEAICGEDVIAGLSALVDASLLRQDEEPDGEPRLTMLETIRAYALERLEASGEADALRLRHAQWFAAVDERMVIDSRVGDIDLLLFERDIDNFRAALTELAARGEREAFIRLVWDLNELWTVRGYVREGAAWSEEAVRVAADMAPWFQARAWECAASFAFRRNNLERADELFRLALDARRGDGPDDAFERAWTVRNLSHVAAELGRPDEADSLSERAGEMFAEIGDRYGAFKVAHDRAIFALQRGDYARARRVLDETVAAARESEDDLSLANMLLDVGILELRERRYTEAVPAFIESLERGLRRGFRLHVALSLRGLAATAATAGRIEHAATMLGAAERIEEETGWSGVAHEREALGEVLAPVLARTGEAEIAAALAAGRAMTDAEAAAFALAGA
jgi:predicted ATPase/class 3 adenylate cyclase